MFYQWRKKCLVLVTVLMSPGTSAFDACPDPRQGIPFRANAFTLIDATGTADPPELTVYANWRAAPETLYRIIWNYAAFAGRIPNVKKSTLLDRDVHRKWVYQQLKLPGPFRDRHYVLESTNLGSRPDQHDYRVAWRLSRRFPLPPGTQVRPAAFSGCWAITPDAQGGLNAIYHIVLDPGGTMPAWLARYGMRQYVKKLMLRLDTLLHPGTAGAP